MRVSFPLASSSYKECVRDDKLRIPKPGMSDRAKDDSDYVILDKGIVVEGFVVHMGEGPRVLGDFWTVEVLGVPEMVGRLCSVHLHDMTVLSGE